MHISPRWPARRQVALSILGYGVAGGLLIAALRWTEYRFLVIEHSVEIYGGLVAAVFAALGIWLGSTLTRKRRAVVVQEVRVEMPVVPGAPFTVDERRQKELGITPRELEILGLIAAGLSNREIAERLFGGPDVPGAAADRPARGRYFRGRAAPAVINPCCTRPRGAACASRRRRPRERRTPAAP